MTDKASSDGQAAEESHAVGLTAERREELADAWDHETAKDEPEVKEPPAGEEPKEPEGTGIEPVKDPDPDPDGEKDPDLEKDEKYDHGEQSKLGRRVKRLQDRDEEREKKLDEALSKIERLTGHIEALSVGSNQEPGPATIDDLDDDALLTAADYKRLRDSERREANAVTSEHEKQDKEYTNGYHKAIQSYVDADDFDQIYEALTADGSEFNKKYTDQPFNDVRLNVAEARLKFGAAKVEPDNKNPKLQGNKAEGTGVGGEGHVDKKEPKGIDINKLSPDARELLDHAKRKGRDPQTIANRALGEKQ